MLTHVKANHTGTKIQCIRCDFITLSKSKLAYHERKEHLNFEYPCKNDSCGMSFPSTSNRRMHEIRHHTENIYCCLMCFERYPCIDFLKRHNKQDHDGLFCDTCVGQFPDENMFSEHNKNKHNNGFIPCDCRKKCYSESHFSWHIKQCHKEAKTKQKGNIALDICVCDLCDYRPTPETPYQLKLHKEAKHQGKKHICPSCQKSFITKCGLGKHIAEKHEKQTVSCNQCEYTATNTSSIKLHKDQKHLGVLYYCDKIDCSFTTAWPSNVRSHQKIMHRTIMKDHVYNKQRLKSRIQETLNLSTRADSIANSKKFKTKSKNLTP